MVMKSRIALIGVFTVWSLTNVAQTGNETKTAETLELRTDTLRTPATVPLSFPVNDSIPTVSFRDVNIIHFKSDEERMLYYKYKSRIQKVLPYVKIAKQLYTEIKDEKENSKRREYKRYRKDVEKE